MQTAISHSSLAKACRSFLKSALFLPLKSKPHLTIIRVLLVATLVSVTVQVHAVSLTKLDDNPGDGMITFTISDPAGDRFWDGKTGSAIDVISAEFRITPIAGQTSGTNYGTVEVWLTAPTDELFSRSVILYMQLVNETAPGRFTPGTATPMSEAWSQGAIVDLPRGQQNEPLATTMIYHSFGTTQVTNWLETDVIAYYVPKGSYNPNIYDPDDTRVMPSGLIASSMYANSSGELNGVRSHIDVIGVQDPSYPTTGVPEPTVLWLLGSGLIGLIGLKKKYIG
jgi:hypothetical protein